MKKSNLNLVREFKGKNILITGGTGSIGMGLAKQLIKYKLHCKIKSEEFSVNY